MKWFLPFLLLTGCASSKVVRVYDWVEYIPYVERGTGQHKEMGIIIYPDGSYELKDFDKPPKWKGRS